MTEKAQAKLHELLAVEKTRVAAANKLLADTFQKFNKFEFFQGHEKTLKMLEDNPQNAATESAAYENRNMPTTVQETLEYALAAWARAEDVIVQKNMTNQFANSDLYFRGEVVSESVPVDELMGLEVRLESLRKVMEAMPTLAASVKWRDADIGRKGAVVAVEPEVTTKTEKVMGVVVLYPATDKHPAQVEKIPSDKTVGMFKVVKSCGAATSAQKAEVMSTIDELIAEVKQARMRANSVVAVQNKIGQKIVDLIMRPFNQ